MCRNEDKGKQEADYGMPCWRQPGAVLSAGTAGGTGVWIFPTGPDPGKEVALWGADSSAI